LNVLMHSPIRHRVGYAGERHLDIALPQMAAQGREPGSEGEGLDPLAEPLSEAVDEVQKEPRVALHRAADVGDDHERPRLSTRLATGPLEDLPTVAEAAAQGPSQIDAAVSAVALPSRDPLPEGPDEFGDHLPDFPDLALAQRSEVAGPEHLPLAVGLRDLEDEPFLGVLGKRLRVLLSREGRRGDERFGLSATDAAAPYLQELPLPEGGLPEHLERLIEESDVVPSVDEEGARRVIDVRLHPDLNVLERLDEVDHPAGVDVEAEAAQHSAEEHEVPKEMVRLRRGGHRSR
jgi:hypothetical protein